MVKIISKNILKNKLNDFQIIIFDLDDTIYEQKMYDTPALLNVSKYLAIKLKVSKNKIFQSLRNLKKNKRGKSPKLIFDFYLKNRIKDKKNFLLLKKKCINLFQKYNCKNLKHAKSLKSFLKFIHKKKVLFMVTNGDIKRQKRKIKYLGVSSYFKKIFILDNINYKAKPSIKSVDYLKKYLMKNKNKKSVFVGDNLYTDKVFAKKLKIKFIHFEFSNKFS